jgi:hypothetical protein
MHRTDDTPSFHGMEATLHDACERAVQPLYRLPTMLRLYRNIVDLTRALMRARMDAGFSPGLGDGTVAMLESVRDSVDMHFPDRQMPVQDAMLLQEAAIKLARMAHRARVGRPMGRLPALVAAATVREDSAPEAPPAEAPPTQAPVPPPAPQEDDDPWADDPHSAWRKDHTEDRDQRAHEKLRTVLEERVLKPAWDEGARLRLEKQARERAQAMAA